jgi:predicted AAA+ superfamily ATPase
MIKRESYLSRLRPFINRDIIKVLTGIRRSGKSVMLELIQEELCSQGISKEQILAVNFESKNLAFAKSLDSIYAYIKNLAARGKGRLYLFFDEVQELEGWQNMVNSCLVDFDADIYITGSNAKLLSGELATYLGGRYVEFKIYPFSFKEVMEMLPGRNITEAFQIYLTRGGMPFLYQYPLDEKSAMQYLSDIYDSIILKDIATRNKIRDIELMKRIILFMIGKIGNTFSAANITKYLKSEFRSVSAETIYNYIDYCKTACFLHMVPREDVVGKKMLQFQEKIFIADHGIREAIYGNNLRDINQTLENVIYIELLRRGYKLTIGRNNGREIDFVAVSGKEKIYVQVAYILATDETLEREFVALETIPDNFPKYVVSMDELDRGRNGIKNVNVRDFLLMDHY